MNTVLDDNKKLCLANSDQIKLSEYMSIIFQVEDLLEASLATVSRCGMVYMEPKQLDPKMLLHNWVDSLPFFYQTEEHRSYYLLLYDKMFLPGLKIFRDSQDIKSIMDVTDHFLVTSFLK
jgi:dynein heavy chain